MALTDQLGAPNREWDVEGRFTLHRYHLCDAAAAAPVTPVDVYAIQDVTASPITFARARKVFQQGGGDEATDLRREPSYTGSIKMLADQVGEWISDLHSEIWSAAEFAAVLAQPPTVPLCTIESVFRQDDNTTHLFTQVYQDIIIDPYNIGSSMDQNVVDIPFHSYHDPFTLCAGAQLCYDVFSGDGSTTVFTLSATPLDVTDVSEHTEARQDWVLDNLVYCKTQASTATTGTRVKSGITLVTTTLTFTTAPASGSKVQVLYVKAS